MTQEQKAKAYDEALEKARKRVMLEPQDHTDAILKDIFPQLKESEDERIKKSLIDCVEYFSKDRDKFSKHGVTKEQVLAYIERPKEQKSAEYLDKDKIYAIMKKLHDLSFSKDILITSKEYKQIDEIINDVRSLLDYPINQQSVEWSEEDEEKLKAICTYLRDYPRLAKLGDKSRFNEYCDFLKLLCPFWKPNEEQIADLCRAEGRLRIEGESVLADKLAELWKQLRKFRYGK